MKTSAKVIADSISPAGYRLTTVEATYPRFILAEVNTHRVISKNSGSSRAIPVKKTLGFVKEHPAFPLFWGKNQKGMQAKEELDHKTKAGAMWIWQCALDSAVQYVSELADIELHKQTANRLIEPFLWQTSIFTATEWENFLALRTDADAQPEFYALALAIEAAINASTPVLLKAEQWHLPYIEAELYKQFTPMELVSISAGRCAKVSYLTHDVDPSPLRDIQRCQDLIASGHMSPTEHQALCLDQEGWDEYAKKAFELFMTKRVPMGNLQGWAQFRKMLPSEHDFSEIKARRASTTG